MRIKCFFENLNRKMETIKRKRNVSIVDLFSGIGKGNSISVPDILYDYKAITVECSRQNKYSRLSGEIDDSEKKFKTSRTKRNGYITITQVR